MVNQSFLRYWRSILVTAVVALCGVSLWISDYLMSVHTSARMGVLDEAKSGSIWAGICGSGEEDPAQRVQPAPPAGCEDVVTSAYGYVTIPWRTTEIKTEKNAAGKIVHNVAGLWTAKRVPVIQLGMCYYVFVGVWFIFMGAPPRTGRRWFLLPLVLAVGAACVTLFYVSIMAFKLDQWCPLCLLLHLTNFLLLAAAILLWPREAKVAGKPRKTRARQSIVAARLSHRHVFATLACAAMACLLNFSYYDGQRSTAVAAATSEGEPADFRQMDQKDMPSVLEAYWRSRPVDLPPRDGQSSLGALDAEHEVVIFSDLLCLHCRQFEDRFKKKIMPILGGDVKLTYRHFPLCTRCNRSQKPTRKRPLGLHANACEAAYATEAARLQGGRDAFWSMHDMIHQAQNELKGNHIDKSAFVEFAQKLGLDTRRFRADMESDAVKLAVAKDVELGIALGIKGTPTAFLDGRRLKSSLKGNLSFWKALAVQFAASRSAYSAGLAESGLQTRAAGLPDCGNDETPIPITKKDGSSAPFGPAIVPRKLFLRLNFLSDEFTRIEFA